jgi:hypothetical protein
VSNKRVRCVVYVDVDETLVHKDGHEEVPNPSVVAFVRKLKHQGARLHCWSSGGPMHARQAARKCGIASVFQMFLAKPNLLIDDERVSGWPECLEVNPRREHHRSLKDLRRALRKRKRSRE